MMASAAASQAIPRSRVMLGSRSPQRLALLELIVPRENIVIAPPASEEEPGFEDCSGMAAISERVQSIAKLKSDAVSEHFLASDCDVLLTADTVVVAHPSKHRPRVLGKPDGQGWENRVREWFVTALSGRTHLVLTAIGLKWRSGRYEAELVTTQVTMHELGAVEIDWYIRTGEPLGKAGGYALQGAGSVLIERVEGSLSNVIGLPLENLIVKL